jgi:hypothetical protein
MNLQGSTSFGITGGHILNLLPENLRTVNTNHPEILKDHLDILQSTITDQPIVKGLGRVAEIDSLLHQLPFIYSETRYIS